LVFSFACIPAFEPASIAPVLAQALLRRLLRLVQIQGAGFAKIPIFKLDAYKKSVAAVFR